jgi:hypothetical protein
MYLVVHANILVVSASVREGLVKMKGLVEREGLVEMESIQVEMKEELPA